MKRLWILLLATLTLAACAPAAEIVADLIERNDGAALTYVVQGLSFDPGPTLARGVIIRAEGDELHLLEVPAGGECTVTEATLDCRLGDVEAPTRVRLTGLGVVASATWRRAGLTVYMTFARHHFEVEPAEGGEP